MSFLFSTQLAARDITVRNVAALNTLRAAPEDKIITLGYTTPGDGGGDVFFYRRDGRATDNGFIFDAPGAGNERFESVDQTVINVRKWGAPSENATSDTDAFTRAVAELKRPGSQAGTIFVPTGRYFINSTLDFGTARGWTLRGVGGNTIQTAESTTYPDSGSNICWLGADGGQMMKSAGAGFKISDIAFFGSTVPQASQGHHTSNRAGLGFQLYFVSGLGSGDCQFDMVSWTDFDLAVKAGENTSDGNCGDMLFNRVQFAFNDLCFNVVNDQGANYQFNNVQVYGANGSEIFAKFDRGGMLKVDWCHITAIDTFLYIGTNATSSYHVSDMKVDGGFTKTPKLLDMQSADQRSNIQVTFDALTVPVDVSAIDARPFFTVKGSATLTVRRAQNFDIERPILDIDGSATPFVGRPHVLFEESVFLTTDGGTWDYTPDFVTGERDQLGWEFRNCYQSNIQGERLPTIGRTIVLTDEADTVPNVRGADTVICDYTTAVTLVYFNGKAEGDEITLIMDPETSVAHVNDLIQLNGATGLSAPTEKGILRLKRVGVEWVEISRSIY